MNNEPWVLERSLVTNALQSGTLAHPSCGVLNANRLDGLRAPVWPDGGQVELGLKFSVLVALAVAVAFCRQ